MNEWIYTNERLPAADGRYLVAVEREYGWWVGTARFVRKTSLWMDEGVWFPVNNVSAWMPLPWVSGVGK